MAITLRQRLVFINAAVLLVAVLILVGIVMQQLGQGLYRQLDAQLQNAVFQSQEQIAIVNGAPVLLPDAEEIRGQLGRDGWLRVLDAQGQITDGLGHFPDEAIALPASMPHSTGIVETQIFSDGRRMRVYTAPLQTENSIFGYVQAAADSHEIQETIARMRGSLALGVPLTLLIVGLINFFAAKQALRPLSTMTDDVAAVTAETMSHRLTVPAAKDEVHALATAFNAMLDRLTAAFQRQQRFTADASHELRTPVTAILGHAELALTKPRTPKAYQRTLTLIRGEAERMQRLIGRMLLLARLETNRYPLTITSIDVVQLCQSLIDTLQPRAQEKHLALTFNAPQRAVISTDADALTQILLNLVENAISYTDDGGVSVQIETADAAITVSVFDTGAGIAEEHLAHIFEAFYRIDESRHKNDDHIGLGLALTYELTQLLGGHIEISGKPGAGTTVRLSLPIEGHLPPK